MTDRATAVWCCSKCGAIYHKDYPRCPNDGAEIVLEQRDPMVGKQIDHYVIEQVIGEGGMGRVYRAHHASLRNKLYAIKVLLGDVAATGSMRKRFTKEAEIASRIDHPNLVGVVDFGTAPSGLPYIVMDFVEGTVLTDVLDAAPMPPVRVVALARQICEGLAYAHDAGLIHRDLKPDNVIIAPGDVPRITDFGLVMTNDVHQERLTSTGMAMGTPAYAAPEQMAGKPIDHRVDLFSLGLSMFEMLTGGMLPWEGTPMEIAAAKSHRDAPTVSARAPDLAMPGDLEALVARLLARNPAMRPNTARELIDQLDALRLDVAAPSPPNASLAQMTRPPGRRALWLVGAVLVGAAAGGAVWLRESARPAATVAAAAPSAALDAGSQLADDPAVELEPPATSPAPRPGRLPAPGPTLPSSQRPARPAPAPTHKTRPHHARPEPTPQTVVALAPLPPPPPPPVEVIAPPVAPVPEPAARPSELHAAIAGVEVHGSLPAGDVERAVRRALPALERCSPKTIQTVIVELTIGEARRAENVRASGGAASSCVANALGSVRTESAPDIGDVNVTVKVAFAETK